MEAGPEYSLIADEVEGRNCRRRGSDFGIPGADASMARASGRHPRVCTSLPAAAQGPKRGRQSYDGMVWQVYSMMYCGILSRPNAHRADCKIAGVAKAHVLELRVYCRIVWGSYLHTEDCSKDIPASCFSKVNPGASVSGRP